MHVLRQAFIASIESATEETKVQIYRSVKHSDSDVGHLLITSKNTGIFKTSVILVTSNIPCILGICIQIQ